MTKNLKHLALLLLLVIMGSFVLACTPNKEATPLPTGGKDNDNTVINFENQVVNSQIVNEFDGNHIIHSYSELQKFFTDHCISADNQAIFNQYNADYFNDNALIFCYFWATDGRIKRQVEKLYIVDNTLQIKVLNILPYPLTELQTDSYFIFNILQVKQADILNITDITVSFKDILKD